MKPLILVLSTTSPAYNRFKEVVINTWLQQARDRGFMAFLYEAGSERNFFDGTTIRISGDDTRPFTFTKFQRTLKFLQAEGVSTNCVFRTNLSSYIDVENLERFCLINQFDRFSYDGYPGVTHHLRERLYLNPYTMYLSRLFPFGQEYRFASGAGVFLGASAVEKITGFDRSLSPFGNELIEDVEMARVLGPEFKPRVEVPRIDVKMDQGNKISKEDYQALLRKGLFHYKFKNKDRSWDVEEMQKFHDRGYRFAACTVN